MTNFSRTLIFCLGLGLASGPLVGCKDSPTIPGTEIPDTDENRDILRVVERYRVAFVRRDAAGVLATAHPTYYDPAGTDDTIDDVEYEQLGPMLRIRIAQIESMRFTIDYLEINVVDDRAVVKVWIDASFRLAPMIDAQTGEVRVEAQHARKQDHSMFELLRDGDGSTWRITKGL